jgi:hypothetical protein
MNNQKKKARKNNLSFRLDLVRGTLATSRTIWHRRRGWTRRRVWRIPCALSSLQASIDGAELMTRNIYLPAHDFLFVSFLFSSFPVLFGTSILDG